MKISKSRKDSEEPFEQCPICISQFRNKSRINSCEHAFCFRCINRWAKVSLLVIQKQKNCPICRSEFDLITSRNNRVTRFERREQRPARPPFNLPVFTVFVPVLSISYAPYWQTPLWNPLPLPFPSDLPFPAAQF